jgi:hypothetical protein
MIERIGVPLARRIALGAQGFGGRQGGAPGPEQLLRNIQKLQLHQIDSVNVLVRAHYLPAYSRLGPYERSKLDRLAWGASRSRKLFEYWAHEASLLPFDLHPLLRWRMAEADEGKIGWSHLRTYATERRSEAMTILERIRSEGPMSAADFDSRKARSGWWVWSDAKRALEWLFAAGHITTAERRNGFERAYDLTERVVPGEILQRPVPRPAEAQRMLVERAAAAHGIATASDLRDYFRLTPEQARQAIESLSEEGVLVPVDVPGWHKTWLHRDARRPRKVDAQALIVPFDPLIWARDRTERLFGFRYRIEIYVPAEKRQHGYYVLPLLLGDRLVARVDLKAARQSSQLIVQATHLEPDAPDATHSALQDELNRLAGWLGLAEVKRVSGR